jgi:hypothetical protein
MDGKHLYMKKSSTSKALGLGKFILKMTFKKLLTLNNIFQIDGIKKDLVFSSF